MKDPLSFARLAVCRASLPFSLQTLRRNMPLVLQLLCGAAVERPGRGRLATEEENEQEGCGDQGERRRREAICRKSLSG